MMLPSGSRAHERGGRRSCDAVLGLQIGRSYSSKATPALAEACDDRVEILDAEPATVPRLWPAATLS
jgi:hypothetical protein